MAVEPRPPDATAGQSGHDQRPKPALANASSHQLKVIRSRLRTSTRPIVPVQGAFLVLARRSAHIPR
jgi:hypothetical protein